MLERKILKITKYKLYLNNEEIIDISPNIIYTFKLKTDMILTEKIYLNVLFEAIKEKAFVFLNIKSRTKYELRSKLKSKFSNKELIEEVITYLQEEKYINDKDYAYSYILTHRNSKQKNILKLMQKGINKAEIDDAYKMISQEFQDEILENEIKKLLEKNVEIANIIMKLMRKGYEYSNIKEIISKLKEAHS